MIIKLKALLSVIFISILFSLMGCSDNSKPTSIRVLFDTKEEAERAAKDINCSGAHKMDEGWMPCNNHATNEKTGKYETHNQHQYHH
tara:strand:- start:2438 stop:2698 length:261 start_codon:yes stop_codon:yes gene_type:complete